MSLASGVGVPIIPQNRSGYSICGNPLLRRLAFNAFKMRGVKVIIEVKVPGDSDTSSSARLRLSLAGF